MKTINFHTKNDGAQPSELGTLHHTELTQLRRDHPEWLLGDDTNADWFASSWNMAVPEVRCIN